MTKAVEKWWLPLDKGLGPSQRSELLVIIAAHYPDFDHETKKLS